MEFRPDIRATPAASLAAKPRLQIGQADVIRPSVAADRGLMRAMIIGAVDQKPANARSAHFGKCDFLRAWTVERGHGAIIAPTTTGVKPLELGPPPSGHTMTRETNCESQILPRSRLRPCFTLHGIKCAPSLRAKQRSEGAGTGEGSLLTPGESGMSRQSNEYTKSPFEVFPIGKHNTGLPTLSIGGAGARFGVCANAGDERSTNAKDAFFISTFRSAYYATVLLYAHC
jgi:hypothetical protein